MACGGFTCSKNALAALNVLYILVAFVLIGVAAAGRWAAVITDLAIMGGIIACGVFLLLIAIVGLIGAVKHHQVLLFFYMIILFLLFLVQFAIACACLAINKDQQYQLAATAWNKSSDEYKNEWQQRINCCGFNSTEPNVPQNMGHPPCDKLPCCNESSLQNADNVTIQCPKCPLCWDKVSGYMDQALKAAGGVGIFFSLTEIIGVWLAVRYRNQKDPRANPSAFL